MRRPPEMQEFRGAARSAKTGNALATMQHFIFRAPDIAMIFFPTLSDCYLLAYGTLPDKKTMIQQSRKCPNNHMNWIAALSGHSRLCRR
jgi:hypothetical protein